MKYVFQIGLLSVVSFIAELLHHFIPLPIPASVYGLVLMFLLLQAKIVKVGQIEDVSKFLLAIMPILFIEPSVGLMASFDAIKGHTLVLVAMSILSTLAVTIVTGRTAQAIIRRKDRQKGKKAEHE